MTDTDTFPYSAPHLPQVQQRNTTPSNTGKVVFIKSYLGTGGEPVPYLILFVLVLWKSTFDKIGDNDRITSLAVMFLQNN